MSVVLRRCNKLPDDTLTFLLVYRFFEEKREGADLIVAVPLFHCEDAYRTA